MNAQRGFWRLVRFACRAMPKKAAVVAVSLGLALVMPPLTSRADDPRAQENVDRVAHLMVGKSSIATLKLEIANENGLRNITMKIWSEGGEKVLIRITSPPEEAGTAILKVGSEIWYYLPKTNRTVKIPVTMTMRSWMGSDLTIDDLVKEDMLTRDYTIATSFKGKRGGTEVFEYTLTPKPDAAVAWGKIVLQLLQVNMMPAWQGYYDEDGKLVRELAFSEYKTMGGRLIPTRLVMRPVSKPGTQTTIVYEGLSFDQPIKADKFAVDGLKP